MGIGWDGRRASRASVRQSIEASVRLTLTLVHGCDGLAWSDSSSVKEHRMRTDLASRSQLTV